MMFASIHKKCTKIAFAILAWMLCVSVIGVHSSDAVSAESTFLVYNESDQASLTIANHYQNLRGVPSSNQFGIDWRGTRIQIPINVFRQQILMPILKEIDRRKLSGQIDCVVYSSGFPYAVDFSKDLAGSVKKFSVGSLTAMTYYYQMVLAKQPSYSLPGSNWYANTDLSLSATQSFLSDGVPAPQSITRGRQLAPRRYLLSAMLGYTDGRGNSIDEAVSYLTSAASADGSFPTGNIYFMENSDIRARTRRKQFEPVIGELKKLGVHAEIESGDVPFKKNQVAGVMAGIPEFKWELHNSQIVPGAFCDNLTSFGGVLRGGAGQTPLSVFLRHGAAGSCGAVIEPYALANKFPHAVFHLHYARGLSLIEAFYRSVKDPYQQLLVGDPLCRPWSKSPAFRVAVKGRNDSSGAVQGAVEFLPSSPVQGLRYELFVDGRSSGGCTENQHLRIDTSKLPDGFHDIRVSAKTDGSIVTNYVKRIPIMVNNHGRHIEVKLNKETANSVSFQVDANGGDGVQAWCRRRLVGVLDSPSGDLRIARNLLGEGPASVQMVAVSAKNRQAMSFARPIVLKSAVAMQHTQKTSEAGSLR